MTTKKKILIGVIITAVTVVIIRVLATIGLIGIMLFGSFTAKPEVYDEISNYTECMSFSYDNADSLWSKWGMDESIWPLAINNVSDIVDYKMVYYNPWDAQYLGYLVMDYSADDYAAETARLKALRLLL